MTSQGGTRIDVVTIFPDYLRALDLSLIGKAAQSGLLDLAVHDLRDWTTDRHRTVDDTPLGGGAGMVMKPDVWGKALDDVFAAGSAPGRRRVLIVPTPSGQVFTQRTAEDLAGADHLVFACGRYEGIDSRVARWYAESGVEVRELSIGDYVLNGGEVATLVMVEAIARLLPGVVGNPESVLEESHSRAGLLEQEVYTRPVSWRGMDVAQQWPALLSGDHARIRRERRDRAIVRTAQRRPDMVAALRPDDLDAADRAVLARCGWLVPHGAASPVRAVLRPATEADVPALADLAARTFPDACPDFLTPEQIAAHVEVNLSPQRCAAWVSDPRAVLNVLSLEEDLRDEDGLVAGAGELLGYSLLLFEGDGPGDGAGGQAGAVVGLDPRPACVEAADGVLVAELSKVYVDVRLRGSGAAALLLAEAQCDAATGGAEVMWLATYAGNRRAQKAYKRAGLRKVGTRGYDVGGRRCRDVVMVVEPTPPHGGSRG